MNRNTPRSLVTGLLVLCTPSVASGGPAQSQPATDPSAPVLLPRQLNLDRLLAYAEQCVREAQAQRNRSDLSAIERIAAATRASQKLAQAYGKTVWLDGRVREVHDRGPVRFTPPSDAPTVSPGRPTTASAPSEITVAIHDLVMEHPDDHLVVLQMTPRRADRVQSGKTYHFTARIVRLRRLREGRWEVWLRHSRVPRAVDGWMPQGGPPAYRTSRNGTSRPKSP